MKVDDIFKFLSVERIIGSAVVVIIALIIWYIIKRSFKAYKEREIKEGRQKTNIGVAYGIIRTIVIVVAVLVILQVNGVNVSSAIAGLGIASAIVGLALQDFIKDIIMGITILTEKFFIVGDAVEYNGRIGIVKKFNLRITQVEMIEDRSVVIIGNRHIDGVVKVSDMVDIDVGLSYKEDPRKIHRVFNDMVEILSKDEDVYDCVYKGTQDFKESVVTYKLRFFCAVSKRLDIRRRVISLIQETLIKEGINIPFNQLDIHIDNIDK